MAFWAMGAYDKVKTMTQKLNIKDMSKKVISYVAVQNHHKQQNIQKTDLFPSNKTIQQNSKTSSKFISNEAKMQIQLREYKKLVKMQEKIVQQFKKKEKQQLQQKHAKLQQINAELIEREKKQRYEFERAIILNRIESGQSKDGGIIESIEDLIEENIKIKQEIFNARNK